MADEARNEERVLIFALFGADATLTCEILSSANIESVICLDMDALSEAIAEGAAALIVSEEALLPHLADRLVRVLEQQAPWSDLPVIVSVTERDYATGLVGALSARVNIVPLERPVHVDAMVSTVRSALRARRKQYKARDLLRNLEQLTSDLRELEEETRTVVENLPELAWSAGPDGYINFYNRRWYDYTGAAFQEMEGWGWQKVLAPEFLPKVIEQWRYSLETGEPLEMEFPIRRADGAFRWFLTRATPLRDKTGRVVRWVGVNVDVDDKRRAAEERDLFARQTALLARASEVLSASLEVEPCLHGLAHALLESIATTVSIDLVGEKGALDGLTVLADRDPKLALRSRELRKKYPFGPNHPLVRALLESRARILDPGPALDEEVSDGVDARSELYAELAISSTIIAPLVVRGSAVAVLAVGSRERKYTEADRALVEQLAIRAAIAVDNARLYAAAQRDRDRTGRLQGLAAAFSAARTPDEVAEVALTQGCEAAKAPRGLLGVLAHGDTMLDVILMRGFRAETIAMWRALPMTTSGPLTDAVRSGTPAFYNSPEEVAIRFPHLAAHRSPGDKALAVLPLTVTGRTFGAMGLVYDEPRSFADDERTQMLTLARLCAQAMDRASLFELAQRERQHAEEASRAKDEFLAMVSHELRTPLNAMLGWTRMLRTGTLDPARREKALETIERNALAQTQLIGDLLDITRIITGKLRLSIVPVDLVHIIEAATETLKPAAGAKGVALQTVLDPMAGHVAGDGDRLQQVVWNLLSNAVKFTPKGGRVEVRLSLKDTNAEIVVDDTGVGIAPEFLPHVFERFRQADGGTTRIHGGLGLGLAIVKHLVELHGGTVDATSGGRGSGTSFVVQIPVTPLQMRHTPPVWEPRAPAPGSEALTFTPQIAGLRVLVVEDEPDARDLLVAFLEERAVVVRAAATAAEGLEQVNEWKPDVILSDIGMPIDDGYAFIQRVRALPNERGGRTPAVALTAYARMEDRRRAMLAGYNMHVSKPIDPAELLLVLANVGGRLTPTQTLDSR